MTMENNIKLIKIKDVRIFKDFLKSIISPSCKFVFTKDGCQVNTNQDRTMRLFYTTDCAYTDSETPIEFCIAAVQKFLECIEAVTEYCNSTEIDISYNVTTISYTGVVRFTLRLIDEKAIEPFIAKAINQTSDIKVVFGCKIKAGDYKKLCGFRLMSSSNKTNVYLYKDGDVVKGEINDTTMKNSDRIAIPISVDLHGSWFTPIIMSIEAFKSLALLTSEDIDINAISVNGQPVSAIMVNLKREYDDKQKKMSGNINIKILTRFAIEGV